ncbi:ATP-grasp domain-containing protein [Kitasatospora sp. NPDC051853]|uniref:ATP-grasp domain-containing protein n=1 Tax=Kitasatospora sp. NPDC051853 TaxID=3364058 RepID=UPI0037A0D790
MTKPHLLMVGGWKELIEKALAVGHRVSFVGDTTAAQWRDGWLEHNCLSVHHASVEQISTCLVHARALHREHPLDAVVSFTEYGLETAAVIADALGVKGLPLRPVALTRYKDGMRAVLDTVPELALRWRKVGTGAELREFWEQHGPELILKPLAGAGSEGVYEIKNARDLAEAEENPDWQGEVPYLTERFVPGDRLYSVETVTRGGEHRTVAVTMAKLIGDPCTVNNYLMLPPPPPYDQHAERLSAAAHRLLDAIGLEWGCAHTELKVDVDGRAVVIESQTRVGGQGISRMIEWSTGLPNIDAVLAELTGQWIELGAPEGRVSVAFSLVVPGGRVHAVADPKVLDAIPEVVDHEIRIEAGAELSETVDNSSRHGLVWLTADTHEQLFAGMRAVCDNYWVEFDDGQLWHPSF